jgi:phosphoribosylaminoimidazolecarboxamide formyltransferase/IMP cyclohydrolase
LRALISVSDKTDIEIFASKLVSLGYEIVSTGNTYKKLKEHNIEALEVSDITNFPECFEGRVKTLNPFIHGGILYKRDSKKDIQIAKELEIHPIDLVCVNLYPFEEKTKKTQDFEVIIENIDIGGPSMIRAAAKNFNDVIVVTSKDDYEPVIDAIKNSNNSLDFRKSLMVKAFEYTASYDCYISNYMNSRFNGGFGSKQFIVGNKTFDTRYGENPHQDGALYESSDFFTKNFNILKGKPSFNNLTDISCGLKIATAFGNRHSVVIIKHGNPCGCSIDDDLIQSYKNALKSDPISAFGGVVIINGIVDKELALIISEIFLEVIFASSFTSEAISILSEKNRIKLFSQNRNFLVCSDDMYDFKKINGGFVFQTSDKIEENEIKRSVLKSKTKASQEQLLDLEIAYKIASLTKSNCIVFVKDSSLVAIGMGMTSRIDATKIAILKAKQFNIDISGSAVASEAFFPFRDSIDELASIGVSSVIEPGGSIRDNEVIEAADEFDISLYFSGVRHFLH